MAAMWEPLSAQQLQLMLQELGASEETLRRDVASIRAWLDRQPHLPRLDDAVFDVDHWVKAYLLRCKNSVERAKHALDRLYAGRTNIPEFFQNRDPMDPTLQDTFKVINMCTMPKPTPDGYRVHVYRYKPGDHEFNIQAIFKRALMVQELVVRDDLSRGEIIVADFKHLYASRIKSFVTDVSLCAKYSHSIVKVYPTRIRGVHVVNAPSHYAALLAVWTLLTRNTRMQERLTIHPEVSGLLQHLPAECLPADLGGSGPSMEQAGEKWKKTLEANQDWFKIQDNLKSDESKRISMSTFTGDFNLHGVGGSFRTLQVD